MHPTGRLLTSLQSLQITACIPVHRGKKEMKDSWKQVKNVWNAELTKRLPVILLIKAKCFKEGRTEKGQTAGRMRGSKLEGDRK